MSKPTAPATLQPLGVPLEPPKRVVVVREANNQYSVYEETYAERPVSRRLLQTRVPRVTATDEVRLWRLEQNGDDNAKGCGL